MITRQDYLSGKATHREYYAQFVTDRVKNEVLRKFPIGTLKMSYEIDNAFNTKMTPLSSWDSMTLTATAYQKLVEAGDFYSMAGKVCIMKEAGRQLIEEQGGLL